MRGDTWATEFELYAGADLLETPIFSFTAAGRSADHRPYWSVHAPETNTSRVPNQKGVNEFSKISARASKLYLEKCE